MICARLIVENVSRVLGVDPEAVASRRAACRCVSWLRRNGWRPVEALEHCDGTWVDGSTSARMSLSAAVNEQRRRDSTSTNLRRHESALNRGRKPQRSTR